MAHSEIETHALSTPEFGGNWSIQISRQRHRCVWKILTKGANCNIITVQGSLLSCKPSINFEPASSTAFDNTLELLWRCLRIGND